MYTKYYSQNYITPIVLSLKPTSFLGVLYSILPGQTVTKEFQLTLLTESLSVKYKIIQTNFMVSG